MSETNIKEKATMDHEPRAKGRELTKQNYLERIKLRGEAEKYTTDKETLPKIKKIDRIIGQMIKKLNAMEDAYEINENSPQGLQLIKLYHMYGVDDVEDLAVILAEQYEADEVKESYKKLVKGSGAIVNFGDVNDIYSRQYFPISLF